MITQNEQRTLSNRLTGGLFKYSPDELDLLQPTGEIADQPGQER